MAGTTVTSVGSEPDHLRIGGADIDQCDLAATNGMIHKIDGIVNSRLRSLWPSHWNRFDDVFGEW